MLETQQKQDRKTLENLKNHIEFLADDKLEGRGTGTEGERLAMEYIAHQFKKSGIAPKGTEGYFQIFQVNEGKKILPSTSFSVNEQPLILQKDFFPLAFSATKSANGTHAIAVNERNAPRFFDVKNLVEENKNNPHFDIESTLKTEADKFASKGATAMLVYNSGKGVDNIHFDAKDSSVSASIPVIYIQPAAYKKYFGDHSAFNVTKLNVAFENKTRYGHNVVGFIDNNAPSTVVIGAHFDHLGWGDDHNALDTGKVIHNGADDNASGTSAMMEIARLLAHSNSKTNNYLFIAFSGEELGLLGSKYWLNNPTLSTDINYMVNLDMVGRYNPDKKLSVGGYGTSPVWSTIMQQVDDKSLLIAFDSTGGGPSDHASFYRKNIPVLFFFTGNHLDYHKATDDADKINFAGELLIVKMVKRIVDATANQGKLAFLKTTEPKIGAVKYSVSLGVIPDYGNSVVGLRIDGVSPNKLGSKIGLQAGDILTALGDFKIADIQTYMTALGGFKPGDKTVLRIKRGTEEKEFSIEF